VDDETQIGFPMRTYQPTKGTSLPKAARNALAIAEEHAQNVVMVFNGTPVTVWTEMTVEQVCALWRKANGLHLEATLAVVHG
jgi:hypothetical protein